MERSSSERHPTSSASVSAPTEIAFPQRATTANIVKPLHLQQSLALTSNTTPSIQPARRGRKPKHKPLKSPPKATEIVIPSATQTVTVETQLDASATKEVHGIHLDKAPELVQQLLEIAQAAGDGHATTLTLTQDQAQEILGQLKEYAGSAVIPSSVNISLVQPGGPCGYSTIDNSIKPDGSSSDADVLLNEMYAESTEVVGTGTMVVETVRTKPVDMSTRLVSDTKSRTSTDRSGTKPATSVGIQSRLKDVGAEPNKALEGRGSSKSTSPSYLSPDIMQLLTQTNISNNKN